MIIPALFGESIQSTFNGQHKKYKIFNWLLNPCANPRTLLDDRCQRMHRMKEMLGLAEYVMSVQVRVERSCFETLCRECVVLLISVFLQV